jgi:AraC family transcriptional regulator
MLLLRSMPDLSTSAARDEYHRIAAERGVIVSAWTRRAVYDIHAEQLSIKAAFGGSEDYFIDGARRAVDDDVYLIINHGHPYESRLDSSKPVQSIAVVFSDAMRASVTSFGVQRKGASGLDDPAAAAGPAQVFDEYLRPHDGLVTPVLKYMARMSNSDVAQAEWYEEQAYFLLERMSARSRVDRARIAGLPFVRRRTRREIYRRIHAATDYLLSCYASPLSLEELADIACLGRYHFLRMFRSVHGVTPFYFLTCKRVAVAARLLTCTDLPVSAVATMVGYGGRDSLSRAFHELIQLSPLQFRRRSETAADMEAALKDVQLRSLLRRAAQPPA